MRGQGPITVLNRGTFLLRHPEHHRPRVVTPRNGYRDRSSTGLERLGMQGWLRSRAASIGRATSISTLEDGYAPRKAYRQSKLANAAFGLELDRRLRAAGSPVKSLLAHPGYSATNLQRTGPTGIMRALLLVGNRVLAQGAEQGALPTLYAATAADAEGGDYYGPEGFQEMRGRPTKVEVIANRSTAPRAIGPRGDWAIRVAAAYRASGPPGEGDGRPPRGRAPGRQREAPHGLRLPDEPVDP